MTGLEQAEAAYKRNKLDRRNWQNMFDKLLAAGRRDEAVFFAVLLYMHGTDNKALQELTEADFLQSAEGRDYFHLGLANVGHVPLMIDAYDDRGQPVGNHYRSCIGRFLPGERGRQENDRYFCGAYNEGDFMDETAKRLSMLDDVCEYSPYRYDNIPFDIMRGKKGKELKMDFGSGTAILPLAATASSQFVTLCDGQVRKSLQLGQYEFRMIRISGKATITSEQEFIWGQPIMLGHRPERHKLVLNILLDGLNWTILQERDFADVPNLRKFFAQGLIFTEAYSPAEYTFASLNAMATGKYMHHSGIVDDAIYAPYEEQAKSISAQMKKQGYYCVNVMGDGRGIMSGAMRGYDRFIVNPFLKNHAHTGIRRTIDHLEAFDECDNYVFLHISDPHPCGGFVPASPFAQTKTSWQDMPAPEEAGKASVWLKSSAFDQKDNLYMIRRMDEELGRLFSYLEGHYQEDEYVVNVFSDHGVSIYTPESYLLKETQCHTVMMCRGAGIPVGVESQELVNGVDLYAIMAKECGFAQFIGETDANLPIALGGQERDIVYSNSLFPGQTYKLCMRTRAYECRLETREPVSAAGRINIDDFSLLVYTRNQEHKLVEDADVRNDFLDKAAEFLLGLVEDDGEDN